MEIENNTESSESHIKSRKDLSIIVEMSSQNTVVLITTKEKIKLSYHELGCINQALVEYCLEGGAHILQDHFYKK